MFDLVNASALVRVLNFDVYSTVTAAPVRTDDGGSGVLPSAAEHHFDDPLELLTAE
ncbi:hypothetical protein [Rhodococcus qingshengii]|uniref:hypothetical protein n=1 Tax=Rhodococcus TaxID=1827 RepID=UPI001BAF835C|nr:hypothetical protein [Rhodococcus qingshengii]MBS3695686.1 hypothetical protein [Rhodococcus qingshengii]